MAPELFNGSEPSPAADMWALGVTLYAMQFGTLPFPEQDMYALAGRTKQANVVYPPSPPRCRKVVKVIQMLLVDDPEKRLTADRLYRSTLLRNIEVPPPVAAVPPPAPSPGSPGRASSSSSVSPAKPAMEMAFRPVLTHTAPKAPAVKFA